MVEENQDYDKFTKSTSKVEEVKKQLADLEESKIKQISDSNDKAAQIKKQMEEL